MFKQRVLGSLLVFFSLFLTGCSAVDAWTAAREPQPEPVEITFAYPRDGSGIMKKLTTRFRSMYPDIVVHPVEGGSAAHYQESLSIRLLSGEEQPDVMLLHDTWIPSFAASGYIQSLEGIIGSGRLTEFLPGMTEVVRVNGQTYGLPFYQDTALLYYRTDLVEEPPDTWAALEAAVLESGVHDLAYGFIFPGNTDEQLAYFASALLSSHNALPDLRQETIALQADNTLRGLDSLHRMVDRGGIPPDVLALSPEGCRIQFETGNALFMWNWSYALRLFQLPESPLYGRVAAVPMPVADTEAVGQSILSGWVIALRQNTLQPKEAGLLMEYLSGSEAQLRLAVEGGLLPARQGLYNQSDWQRALGLPRLVPEALAEGKALGTGPAWQMQMRQFHQAVSQIIGSQEPAKVLDALQSALLQPDLDVDNAGQEDWDDIIESEDEEMDEE